MASCFLWSGGWRLRPSPLAPLPKGERSGVIPSCVRSPSRVEARRYKLQVRWRLKPGLKGLAAHKTRLRGSARAELRRG